MYFLGTVRGLGEKGKGRGRIAQGGVLWDRIIWCF